MSTGIMLAFYLSAEKRAELYAQVGVLGRDAVPPEEYHLTLVYLGDMAEMSAPIQEVIRLISGYVFDQEPISGKIAGVGSFNPNLEQDTRAIYASVDAVDMPKFRQGLIDLLQSRGIAGNQTHGFSPHVTLGYIPANAPIPDLRISDIAVTFDKLIIAWGDVHYPLILGPDAMNNKDDKRKFYSIPQVDAKYTTVSPVPGKMCANCRWFSDSLFDTGRAGCNIVENWPNPILPTGLSSRWEPMPTWEITGDRVVLVQPDGAGEREVSKVPELPVINPTAKNAKGMADALVEWFGKMLPNWNTPGQKTSDPGMVSFKVIGNKWFALWSNNFYDREKEVFPARATDRFIERVEKGDAPYPELWFWHMPVKIGVAEWLGRIDHMSAAAGVFYDDPVSQKFMKYFATTKEQVGVSHGFWFPSGSKINGMYEYYDTFEISPLPLLKAANLFTSFEAIKEMTLTDEKKQKLRDVLGPLADSAIQAAEQKSKEVAAMGVGYKGDPKLDVVDETARGEIASLRDEIKALPGQFKEALKEALEAAGVKQTPPPPTTDPEADKKKRDDMVKEVLSHVSPLVENGVKQYFEGLTPAHSTKDTRTVVDPAKDPALQGLVEGMNGDIKKGKSLLNKAYAGLFNSEGE